MKLSCDIIKDLWILYENDECSEDSKRAVEQHLSVCKTCQQSLKKLNLPKELIMPEEVNQTKETAKAVKKSVNKIKKRWIASLVAVLSIIPIIICSIMGVNQYRGEGICYTNLDEIVSTYQFLKDIKEENFEQAVERVNFVDGYESICEVLELETPEMVEIDFGEEVWIAKPYFAEQWFEKSSYTEEEANEWWMYFINNQISEVCIPEDIWNETRKVEKGIENEYERLETECGVFYKLKSYSIEKEEIVDAMNLYCVTSFMPKEIYEMVKPDLEEELQESKEWLVNKFGNTLQMSFEQYEDNMQEKLLTALNTYKQTGAKIINLQYEYSYYIEDAWRIEYRLIEKNAMGKENSIILQFDVTNGGVQIVAFRYQGYGESNGTVLEDVVLNWKLDY